jgi:hypothetical protein
VLLETPVWLLPVLTEVVWLRTRAAAIWFTVCSLARGQLEEAFGTKLPYRRLTPKIVSLAFFGAGTLLSSRISIPETKHRQPQLVKTVLPMVVAVISVHRSLLRHIDVHSAWRGSGRQGGTVVVRVQSLYFGPR